MYKLLIFTFQLSAEEISKTENVIRSVIDKNFNIYNIPNFKVDDCVVENSIIITFGITACQLLNQYLESNKKTNIKTYNFPHLKHLELNIENKENRKRVYNALLEIKELLNQDLFIPEVKEIRAEDIPVLDHLHILMLKKMVEDAGEDMCYQANSRGKLVKIGNKDADITFHELYTVRSVMDILETKKVERIERGEKKDGTTKI